MSCVVCCQAPPPTAGATLGEREIKELIAKRTMGEELDKATAEAEAGITQSLKQVLEVLNKKLEATEAFL